MRIPDKLKVNRFKIVNLPSNKDYFQRFGNRTLPESLYTGDDVAPTNQRKIDSIADYDAYDRMMQDKELRDAAEKDS